MDRQLLESFVAVATHGSVSHAAMEVHKSQSTLSRHLSALEKHLGTKLLTREARGMSLTRSGKIVYSHAAALLEQFHQLHESLAAERSGTSLLRLGIAPGVPKHWLSDQLTSLARYTFIINELTTNEQHKLLEQGHLDLALTHERSPDGASNLALEQPVGITLPTGSPLCETVDEKGAISVASLDGMTIMAHSQAAMRSSEGNLKSLAAEAGADINWVFRRFSQYGDLIAKFSNAEGALTTSSSGLTQLPDWLWFPLTSKSSSAGSLQVKTWLNWKPDKSQVIDDCVREFLNGISTPPHPPRSRDGQI